MLKNIDADPFGPYLWLIATWARMMVALPHHSAGCTRPRRRASATIARKGQIISAANTPIRHKGCDVNVTIAGWQYHRRPRHRRGSSQLHRQEHLPDRSRGTTGSLTGDLVDNSTLVVNRADRYSFSGVLSGSVTFREGRGWERSLRQVCAFTGTTALNRGGSKLSPPVVATIELAVGGNGVHVGDVLAPQVLKLTASYEQTAMPARIGPDMVSKQYAASCHRIRRRLPPRS